MAMGVLGLQGDFEAHCNMLKCAGAESRIIKKPAQLCEVDGLIIPGGESTTLIKLMDGFWDPIRTLADAGKPVMGTCAGAILLAKKVRNPAQNALALIDITVERNGYGRQRESFETTGVFLPNGAGMPLPMVFIRAPRICRLGKGVTSLATWQGECVMARQKNIVVASFHPELTDSLTVHRYFLKMGNCVKTPLTIGK